MATFTFTFNVPDDQMDRINAALRKHFGPVVERVTNEVVNPETGEVTTTTTSTQRELTGDELLARVRQMSIDSVKNIVISVEAEAAARAARDAVTAVVVE